MKTWALELALLAGMAVGAGCGDKPGRSDENTSAGAPTATSGADYTTTSADTTTATSTGNSEGGAAGSDAGSYKRCLNGVRDADESDVDCGGPVCRRCDDGQACGHAADCISLGCSGAICSNEQPVAGAVGTRCRAAGDCELGLDCFGQFFGERPQCTRACDGMECPDGSICVDEIPAYSEETIGPYCLRPCELSADCTVGFGSECDSLPSLDGRYCF